MSTSSTVRRFGATKTYGRTRGSNSKTSFDEKTVAIKASPAHTKWGKTNFVAIREDKKSVFEPQPEPAKKDTKPEDPFSFDTEDKRKGNTKTQRTVIVAEPQKASTRLPASRIVTQGKRGANVEPKDFVGAQSNETAIARPGRTYSRSQEGRLPSSPAVPSSQLILDQFVEVGKTVRTDSGYEVVYSIEPHEPGTTSQIPATIGSSPPSVKEKTPPPKRPRAEAAPPSGNENRAQAKSSAKPSAVSDDEDDDDIFPATFRRTPLKTYTGEIITPVIDIPDDPPPKKRKKGPTGLPRGRRPSRYTDPGLIEEYRKRYEATHGKKEPTAGMFNSTVVSSKELKGTQGTTLVVVCKPKVEVSEKKDDVQTKYFKNVKKELNKADKNLEAAETTSQEDASSVPSTPSSQPAAAVTPSPIIKKSSASSQDTSSANSTPTRILKVRFADEETCSAANTLTSLSKSLVQKQPARTDSRQKQASQSNQESVSSDLSDSSSNSTPNSSSADKNDSGIASRTRSGGGRQYRIFKSRGPPQPATKDTAKEGESGGQEDKDENGSKADSPPMPELTPEAAEVSNGEDTADKEQNPPDITDEAEAKPAAESPQVSLEKEAPSTDSQVSQQSGQDISETAEESAADSQARTSDSQETPSPVASDDSQELSQEVSPAEGSQKEDSVPAAPRRFFKSKTSSSASSLQRKVFEKSPLKASYNVRSWQREEEGVDKEGDAGPPPAKQAKKALPFSKEAELEKGRKATREPQLTRSVHWPKDKHEQAYTSVKVQKQHKDLYTVVHNVKMAYEVQESGETQDFMDDVEYLLENLKDSEPISIRALSTIQLAAKCISPAFRMHLRAHGTVTKIFSLLHDACSSPCLALSTASMMFMLSRDRLNMDLDKESLHLMLKLNEVDTPRSNGQVPESPRVGAAAEAEQGPESAGEDSADLEKWRARVQDLLVQLQKETNAKQIDLDFVSTGNLAMESLLSLTSRRAGEWFKEELRVLGGLDHFVETIHRCGSGMKGDLASNLDNYTPSLRKLDRCLRVLENITLTNTDNQNHVIAYNNGLLITATGRLLQQCVECLPTMPLQEVENEVELKEQAGWIVFDCLLAILRVMLNVTHDNEQGSGRVGQEEGLLHTVLTCVACTQWSVPPDQRFDLLVLSLGLLINLMEHSASSRQYLVDSRLMVQTSEHQDPVEKGAVETLVQLFLQRETAARQMEEAPETPSKADDSVNKSGEWRESDSGIEWIARSAEKVKAAEEEQRKEAAKEGAKEGDGDGGSKEKGEEKGGEEAEKPIDGASILEDEETFTKALHKAGKHMENSIVASYVGLLLGCLIQEKKDYVETVRKHLPEGSFDSMIKILKKFLGFMNLTTAIGSTDANSIQRVIDTLEAC
ncbi:uncharacterized protein LOC143280963 [Babylonia areolata]|uniref:uncharacterized protein LOC143280963 n=1 Tax=Babylonia areolata TaxID=304850 RepID=UPI003FD30297